MEATGAPPSLRVPHGGRGYKSLVSVSGDEGPAVPWRAGCQGGHHWCDRGRRPSSPSWGSWPDILGTQVWLEPVNRDRELSLAHLQPE
jgi:hypothetical protein